MGISAWQGIERWGGSFLVVRCMTIWGQILRVRDTQTGGASYLKKLLWIPQYCEKCNCILDRFRIFLRFFASTCKSPGYDPTHNQDTLLVPNGFIIIGSQISVHSSIINDSSGSSVFNKSLLEATSLASSPPSWLSTKFLWPCASYENYSHVANRVGPLKKHTPHCKQHHQLVFSMVSGP